MQIAKQTLVVLRILVLLLILIALLVYGVYLGYQIDKVGFGDYLSPKFPSDTTFERAKTIWDWLGLLVIPLLLTFGALFINNANQTSIKVREEERARLEKEKVDQREKFEKWMGYDRAREQALQEFFSTMEKLILQNNLRESAPGNPVSEIARARTLDILRRLDGERKRLVVDFLYQTGLINKPNPCVPLVGAGFGIITNLLEVVGQPDHLIGDYFADVVREANLQQIYLKNADLRGGNFTGVWFLRANLKSVDFSNSDLSQANLSGANMKKAVFVGAKLISAKLNATNLEDVNFANSDLNNAQINEAILRNVNFGNTDLRHVEFRNAVFENVDLRSAKIYDAVFDQANLIHCKLTREQLSGVRSYKGAILPDGF